MVVFPISATYCIAKAAMDLMKELKEKGTTESFVDRMIPFSQFNSLVGLEEIRNRETFYLEDLYKKVSQS